MCRFEKNLCVPPYTYVHVIDLRLATPSYFYVTCWSQGARESQIRLETEGSHWSEAMSDNEYWLVAVPGESNQREARTGLNERLRNYSLVMDFQIPELKVCLASAV